MKDIRNGQETNDTVSNNGSKYCNTVYKYLHNYAGRLPGYRIEVQVDMMSDTADTSEKFALLTDSRRRHALYALLSNEYANLESLSVQIAAWEHHETIASVPEEAQESVKISLHHNHLPRLQDANLIEYDDRSGDIVVADGFDDIRSFVEEFRADEEETSIEDSPESSLDEDESEPALFP